MQKSLDCTQLSPAILLYLTRLVRVTLKQELQASEISSEEINHSLNKTLLVFDFFNFFLGNAHSHHTQTRQVDQYADTTIGQVIEVRISCRLKKISRWSM